MNFFDRAKELATQARGKAEELAEKAGPSAAKGLDAAKSSLDKATGGKYHDKIESVSSKVEGVLKRDQNPPKEDGPSSSGTDETGKQGPDADGKGGPSGSGPTGSGPDKPSTS